MLQQICICFPGPISRPLSANSLTRAQQQPSPNLRGEALNRDNALMCLPFKLQVAMDSGTHLLSRDLSTHKSTIQLKQKLSRSFNKI